MLLLLLLLFVISERKRKKNLDNTSHGDISRTDTELNINDLTDNSIMNDQNNPTIYEYEPKIRNMNKKIEILFETTSQLRVKIKIDPDKTIGELIKFYFKIVNKPNLYGDPNIRFIINATLLLHNSKDLIKAKINSKLEMNTIIIDDLDDKIKTEALAD